MSSSEATPVNSSINVSELYFVNLSDVITIRQKPNRFDEVFSICGDLVSGIVAMKSFQK